MPLLPALRRLRELGFSAVEMVTYVGAKHSVGEIPGFAYHRASEKERQAVFDATRGFARISAHLPFHDLHPFSFNEDVRQFSVDLSKKAIDGLAFLEGELAVFHVGGPGPGVTYKDIWKPMVDTLRALGDHAGRHGIRVGVETMQPPSVQEYAQLIHDVAHPHVGATIDTGHIRGAADLQIPLPRRQQPEARQRYNDVLAQVLDAVGDKLLHFHLTDVRAADWVDHHTVGTGIVDFARLVATLKKRRFPGLMVFELEEPDEVGALQASRAHMAKLLG
jgi:sugar phosphate isomerase/epimerase